MNFKLTITGGGTPPLQPRFKISSSPTTVFPKYCNSFQLLTLNYQFIRRVVYEQPRLRSEPKTKTKRKSSAAGSATYRKKTRRPTKRTKTAAKFGAKTAGPETDGSKTHSKPGTKTRSTTASTTASGVRPTADATGKTAPP